MATSEPHLEEAFCIGGRRICLGDLVESVGILAARCRIWFLFLKYRGTRMRRAAECRMQGNKRKPGRKHSRHDSLSRLLGIDGRITRKIEMLPGITSSRRRERRWHDCVVADGVAGRCVRPWPTMVDHDRPWSAIVEHGRPCATLVDHGRWICSYICRSSFDSVSLQ